MWHAWNFDKVSVRQEQFASRLSAAAVTWRRETAQDYPAIESMVRSNIDGCQNFQMDPDCGAVIAEQANVTVGVAVVAAVDFGGQRMAVLRYLAVAPAHRNSGVGAVTVGLINQLVQPATFSLTIGNCAVRDARFFMKTGFTVHDPGVEIELPFGREARLANISADQPCWMIRDW